VVQPHHLRILDPHNRMKKKKPADSFSFFENVWAIVVLIPKGRVTTYGAIARYLGTGMSARMVGWAMNAAHTNKKIPAHRVVNRIGLLTGKHHFETPSAMKNLLQKEGIVIKKDQVQDFKTRFWDPAKELL
jgi:methylated-DNA-protein-cysteine methyltransferase-like protein